MFLCRQFVNLLKDIRGNSDAELFLCHGNIIDQKEKKIKCGLKVLDKKIECDTINLMERKTKKDYQITSVRLPPEEKKHLRILAAHNGTSMTDMAAELLSLGLAAYGETHGLPPESIQAKTDTAA